MALTSIKGFNTLHPNPFIRTSITTSANAVIDATGEKVAICGRCFAPSWVSGTKAIRRVIFRLGACTSAGGSGWTVSLQDVDLANGPTIRPDGVQDQTVALAAAAVGTGNVWIRTGTLNADRTVNIGDLLAVVIEYDGSGRLGSDSLIWQSLTDSNVATLKVLGQSSMQLFTASWAALTRIPLMLLECDDGSYITLYGAYPALPSTASATSTTGIGLDFTVLAPLTINSLWAHLSPASGGNFNFCLYAGNTRQVIGPSSATTILVDQNALNGTGEQLFVVPIIPVDLAVGTTYRIGIEPTTANNVTVYYNDFYDANAMDLESGGQEMRYNTVTIATPAWGTATTTRRPDIGFGISQIDSGGASAAIAKLITDTSLVGAL